MRFSVVILALLALRVSGSIETPLKPTRETQLVAVTPEKISRDGISDKGEVALAIFPDKWRT